MIVKDMNMVEVNPAFGRIGRMRYREILLSATFWKAL